MLAADFTTRDLPGSFWQIRRESSTLQFPRALPSLEGCSCPPGGSPSPSLGLWSLQRESSYSSKELCWVPGALMELHVAGGLILMIMF
jgi:hypothetical protein